MTDKTLNLRHTKKLPITDDIRAVYDAAYAKKQRQEKAEAMAVSIAPWMHRLYDAYMAKAQFPILPYIIGDYYKDDHDKEIAIIIAVLTVHLTDTEASYEELMNLIKLIGPHPYRDFFQKRQFAFLSLGEEQDKRLGAFGSMKYWQIAQITQSLWERSEARGQTLKNIFLNQTKQGISPFIAITDLVDMRFVRNAESRINLLLMALCTDYGIGTGLWHYENVDGHLSVPLTKETINMAKLLMPDCRELGFSVDEVARIFGFKPAEFWYLQKAYYRLSSIDPKTCGKYMRRYHTQYKHYRSDTNNRSQLKILEPNICL